MQSKEKEIITVREEVREADGILYRYTLTSEKASYVAGYGLPLYSISVRMHFLDTGRLSEGSVNGLFADIGKAIRFFDMLVTNLATPVDLPYIVEDELYD